MDTESDVEESHTTETYVTEDGMYMLEGDGGWMLLPVIENDPTSEFIPGVSEAHFHSLVKLNDLFELNEDKDHYILTFNGAGGDYKKISLGHLKGRDEEMYEDVTEMLLEGAGTYIFTIEKDTFYVVGLESNTETVTESVFETHAKEQISYQYSDFNETEEIVVPSDVVENAQVIN